MQGKELPQPKKNLKSFILEEDAKVMDKTATKVAITASFLAINALANTEDANAKGHKNHSNHNNNVNAPNNAGTGIHAGTNPTEVEVNNIPKKSVETWHGNHYNHVDASGGQGLLGSIIGAVAVAAGAAVGGFGFIGLNFATAAFAGGIGVGGYAGGALFPEGGEGESVDTDTPYHIPETILKFLQEEED